ncbi:hypothetical protein [Parasphingopyxis lamellibrachiae]|uniref:Acetoacetate decarboxylase n=1 Tax=Parasphingopyxis lamellibrachiae TaxID=680125 RepID=A0A3D9FF11_9SPHN|nr:hypothetical protein [Parasphingopyxis lamellibrachiae]RED16167.1 hypothetical protein DFR46_1183 [Parasphingopyxis lamellibrachiae]
MSKKTAIFEDNPITSSVDLSTGKAPTPYLVHDGQALLVFGSVDGDALQSNLADEAIHPVATFRGRMAAGFILADFHEASMGPHCELQFFVLTSDDADRSIGASPFALPLAMATRPKWATVCMRLWNNTRPVIAYNNEYLGLNAEYGEFDLFKGDSPKGLEFAVTGNRGEPIVTGSVRRRRSTAMSAMWQMAKLAGLRRFLALGAAPFVSGHVVNRVGSVMPFNRRAQIFTMSDHNVVRPWSDTADTIQIHEPEIHALGFRAVSVQHLWPFRFVYRHPDDGIRGL